MITTSDAATTATRTSLTIAKWAADEGLYFGVSLLFHGREGVDAPCGFRRLAPARPASDWLRLRAEAPERDDGRDGPAGRTRLPEREWGPGSESEGSVGR